MADLTRDDILKLAQLARIDLDETEADAFVGELSAILAYVRQLDQVDVTGLKPTSQVTGLTNVMRADTADEPAYTQEDLLRNVPHVEQEQLKVKRMIG
jgi:aspartyl-tRNA(Asn)/glutamyl-tRNA(Gln) amidotransferase subunit C